MARLKNKVVIMTGADGGICHCAAQIFAKEGAKVVMVDISPEVKNKAEAIKKAGGEAIGIAADISKLESWEQILKTTIDTYGTVDCCVNGAARMSLTGDWDTDSQSMDEWDGVINLNLKSMLYSYKTVLKYMIDHKIKGNFINFTSSTGLSYNGSGCEAYPITKAGIKLITNDMAAKHGKDGIRFNCVAPNAIKVPKMVEAGVFEKYGAWLKSTTPMNTLGDPEDVVWAMVYLASDEAKFVSGALITIDGGWSSCH